ncbi:MAG: hypothetical protein ACE5JG_12750, partial [Planctomycetota bacterium]
MRPRVKAVLGRARRLLCPVCGRGRIFLRGLRRADRCGGCGWRFERCAGHWVGGSEVHMFATFGVGALLLMPLVVLFCHSTLALTLAMAVHTALSVWLYRYSRAFFLALDYLVDPSREGGGGDGGREAAPGPAGAPPPSGGGVPRPRRRPVRVRADGPVPG